MLGKPVVRELVNAGFEITAMVRDPAKAKGILPDQVCLVKGDLQNRNEISTALEHADAVYLNLSTRPEVKKHSEFIPERDGLEKALDVVGEINTSQNSIQRVAAISSMVQRYQGMNGFHWWAFEIKKWAIQTLKNASVPTTIFFPSSFMETLDQGGVMQGNRLMLVGTSRHPIHFIAGSDYGRMVAQSFKITGDEDREYNIQGSQSLTFEDAAMIYMKNFRRGPLKIIHVPMWLLKISGLFNSELHYLARIMEALNHYPEPSPDEKVWRELGRPEVNLASYAGNL